MIDLQTKAAQQTRRLWSDTVRQRIHTLDLDDHMASSEISESLAAFCAQHPHMPDHTLSLLLARSFCAAGDAAAAGWILRHDHLHRAHAETWLDALSSEYPFPELYPLFASRILHPVRLNTVRCARIWELDLGKISLTPADCHEIILLQTLRLLVENVSNVWKKSDGEGALAVKGLRRLSDFLHSHGAPDLPGYLRAVLHHRARKNGWSSTPSVLLLDF